MKMRIPFLLIILIAVELTAETLAPRLPNGLLLKPAGTSFDVGNMPLSVIPSPEGDRLVLLLSGFGQHGVQVVDPKAGTVLQTLAQPAAFFGIQFSRDGKWLFASGGYEDSIYVYEWKAGVAQLSRVISLGATEKGKEKGYRYPAGLAISKTGTSLYVAENVSDTLAVVDIQSGSVTQRLPAGHYPYAVVTAPNGTVYVSAWGESKISRFIPDSSGKLRNPQTLATLRHPSALLLNAKGSRLFVASGSTDSIGVIDTNKFRMIRTFQDSVPGTREGSTPNAFALSEDEKRLFVAEADSNAVAVLDVSSGKLLGRIPVGWYPVAFHLQKETLYVVNGKGKGTRANPKAAQFYAYRDTPNEYTLGQLNGTITVLSSSFSSEDLANYSRTVRELNGWDRSNASAKYPPFKHVFYVIKENRTYDQVFGDLTQGDGDPSLLFFPRKVSPNHHALAERFGLYDRFFVNAETSMQGHPWSTSAYVTDFVEKTVHLTYSDRRPDLKEDEAWDPVEGYFWDLAIRNNISLRIYGEYAEQSEDKSYRSTKANATKFTSPIYPSYNLSIQDQARIDAWLTEFREYEKTGELPALQIFHLPSDHTSATRPGKPTPAAYFADNDLALGRMIEALSHSQFWKDTVVFVLEDDSQSGPDHVDSHRSVMLTISAYNKSATHHRFVNTTDVVATVEQILGLGSFSQFDRYGRPLSDVFSDEPDLTPYKALIPEQSLTEMNPAQEGAISSEQLYLDKEDSTDDDLFNRVLWAAIKGSDVPYPDPHRISLLQVQQEK